MSFTIDDIASAGERRLAQLDAISQNLANASTPAYKSLHLDFAMISAAASPESDAPVYESRLTVDHSQGQLVKTGNPSISP